MVLGIILLGTRQLGFGVLVHECGHGTLFESRRLNKTIGEWLAAAPTFNNMQAYRRGHIEHHRFAGTVEDPDLEAITIVVAIRDAKLQTVHFFENLIAEA